MRHPADIMSDFDHGANYVPESATDIDMRGMLWEVLDDACDSFKLAMRTEGVSAEVCDRVHRTVTDYLAENYGDD